ncbi:carbohydrate ABC transporter permease [Thermoactinospora rubra]|uniref:carbohydrate ABC transporter permease n=1 Tax=Thermoactinospora rubra TaxID=1088767 RepID=UPI000A103EA5|nr:sugar ABC transporter permease [Thermoactinospora rubra]
MGLEFDFGAEQPKLVMLLLGVVAFLAVVGVMLLLLDRAPMRSRSRLHAAILLAPALTLLTIGLVVPAVRTTLLSFMSGDSKTFVGLDNYVWMFSQPEALLTLRNTLLWVVLVPLLVTGIGLVYAVLVDRSRFEALAKSLVFMPMAISFVGAGIIWKFVYAYRPEDADQIGLLNQIVVWLGGEPRQWLQEPPLNNLFLIFVLVWIQAGFATVVLSAAIKGIPAEIVEAARLDGAGALQMFFRVTLPSIRPAVIVVLVTQAIGTLKLFDIVRTMTNGNFDTSVIAVDMYNNAFRFGETGKGAALAVFLFVLVAPIVWYQTRLRRRVQ